MITIPQQDCLQIPLAEIHEKLDKCELFQAIEAYMRQTQFIEEFGRVQNNTYQAFGVLSMPLFATGKVEIAQRSILLH